MTLDQLRHRYKKDILGIASRHGASHVRIFGSVVRNEADDRSDVDVLVDLEAGRSLLDLSGLLIDLQELLKCPVDVVTEAGLHSYVRDKILDEAISL